MKAKTGLKARLKQQKKNAAIDFAIGAVLGALFFIVVFGISTLDVTYDSWIYAGYMEEDILQSYAGWMFYRQSPWSWPLTVAENVMIPAGTSIAYTDSIPLVAVLCKFLSPVFSDTFQYFGWYNLLNCVLQGGFAMLLLRHFKLGRVYSGIASLLFIGAPIFVERLFRHSALGSQWILLAALLCYFTARHREKFPAVGFWLLCTFSIGIHGYFVPMVYAVLAAALLERVFKERKILKPALFLGLCFTGTLVVAYVFGLLTRGGGHSLHNYGYYSMNLNAPFNPSSWNFFAEDTKVHWSRILPVLPQNYAQYDGFNYLGFGVLLAQAAMIIYGVVRMVKAIVLKDKGLFERAWRFIKSHIWLLAVLLCLSVFSVSNIVVWDERTLFSYSLPDFVLRLFVTFRSSGRLFWPITYLLTLAPLVFVGRVVRGKWKTGVVVLFVGVQLFDISGALVEKYEYFSLGPIVAENEYTSEGWVFLMENYDVVMCLGNIFDYPTIAGMIRYNPNMQTNAILANQGDFEAIEIGHVEMVDFLRSGERLPDGTIYLCTDDETFEYVRQGLHPDARGYVTGHMRMICNPVPGCPLPEYMPLPAAA